MTSFASIRGEEENERVRMTLGNRFRVDNRAMAAELRELANSLDANMALQHLWSGVPSAEDDAEAQILCKLAEQRMRGEIVGRPVDMPQHRRRSSQHMLASSRDRGSQSPAHRIGMQIDRRGSPIDPRHYGRVAPVHPLAESNFDHDFDRRSNQTHRKSRPGSYQRYEAVREIQRPRTQPPLPFSLYAVPDPPQVAYNEYPPKRNNSNGPTEHKGPVPIHKPATNFMQQSIAGSQELESRRYSTRHGHTGSHQYEGPTHLGRYGRTPYDHERDDDAESFESVDAVLSARPVDQPRLVRW